MSRRSRVFVIQALVFPCVASVLAFALMSLLLPFAPPEMALHWSENGTPAYGSPRQLLFVPLVTTAVSLVIWGIGPVPHPLGVQWPAAIGNAAVAFLNTVSIVFLFQAIFNTDGLNWLQSLFALVPSLLMLAFTVIWGVRNSED